MSKGRVVAKTVFECPVLMVVGVVDGDTQDIMLDLGYSTYRKVRTRLMGIDTPEMSTPAGKLVKAVVEKLLSDVVVEKYKLRWISSDIDMYGRSVGVFVNSMNQGETLNAFLMRIRVAKAYSGESKRPSWSIEELRAAESGARAYLDR